MDSKELSVEITDGQFEEVLATAYSPTVALSELIKNASDACYIKKDTIAIEVNTAERTVVVKDNGKGLSLQDIQNLKDIGESQKMAQNNVLSEIGEPYAGSKGLGILTAFNLSNQLEILTHSITDNKSYSLSWKKGTKIIHFDEYDQECTGTTLTMKDVSEDSIRMITHKDEIQKLFLSSITYYEDSGSLPTIELYIDGVKQDYHQLYTLEEMYNKYDRPRTKSPKESFFVSKATFKYKNNKLTLSHEDNLYNVCSFENVEVDLSNINSVRKFLSDHDIIFKSFDKRLGEYDHLTPLDEFEGVYYVWRETRKPDFTYPPGVRIYVNNYGLYNYLGDTNDWTQHSQISQNISATNYKFKNTYGYVLFKNFDESHSRLKISKERNDFNGNLAFKKFNHIMCGFVSGIFSSIDITLKKSKGGGLSLVPIAQNRKTVVDKPVDIRDLVRTELSGQQLIFEHGDDISIDRERGLIHVKTPGDHVVNISNRKTTLSFNIKGEDPTPYFELPSKPTRVKEGSTQDLLKLVRKNTLVNVTPEDIVITSDYADIDRNILTKNNRPGKYPILYTYTSDRHPEISEYHDVEVFPLYESDVMKMQKLFPKYAQLQDYYKLNDVADQISTGYINSPVVCGIALRSLIEITMRHFIEDVLEEEPEKELKTLSKLNHILNLVAQSDPRLDQSLLDEYGNKLKRNRSKLVGYYKRLDLNDYVHSAEAVTTSSEIYVFSRQFKKFLHFIYKSLALKQPPKDQ